MTKKGFPFFERAGRPPRLDSISMDTILVKLRGTESIDRMIIRQYVELEVQNTLLRRFPAGIPAFISLKISRASIHRYINAIVKTFEDDQENYYSADYF